MSNNKQHKINSLHWTSRGRSLSFYINRFLQKTWHQLMYNYTSWNVCTFSLLFSTFLMNINSIPSSWFIITESLWHSNTKQLSFSSTAPLWGFCRWKRLPTQCFIVRLCNESWWHVPLCWFIWIPAAWLSGCGPSLYPSTGNIMEICPHPLLDESPLIISSKNSTIL